MQDTYTLRKALLLILCLGAAQMVTAQNCVTISNLPDTIVACKNSKVTLNPTVTTTGLLATTDTTWTPATGLSNPNIINPTVTTGTASQTYVLTVAALTPNNFVANGNFSGGKTGFTSGYIVGTGGTWGPLSNEGTYEVTTNPQLVHSNFATFGDHTTGTGHMMVVNGSATANISVWCQTITVQPNTWYDFSAWGASCVASNPAILQFSINSNLLGAPFALPITTGIWQEFHATWFSGANTSANICITNQNTQPSGNDFAIDDIQFREVCQAVDSVHIRVVNLVPGITQVIDYGCQADTVRFTANSSGDAPNNYNWDFGDGFGSTQQNPEHIYTVQGVYTIKLVTEKDGCKDSSTTSIDTRHPLTIGITTDRDSICAGEAITFTSGGSGTTPLVYYWDFQDAPGGNLAQETHTFNTPGVYNVFHTVTDQVPCSDTATTTVWVFEAPTIDMAISNDTICIGTSVEVMGKLFDGYNDFRWEFGDGSVLEGIDTTTHAYDQAGIFNVKLTATYPKCPDATISKTVEVLDIPHVDLGEDTSMCPNAEPLVLFNHYFGNNPKTTYTWSNGETGPNLIAKTTGIYWLQANNLLGCGASDSIEIFKSCYLDMPNAFTPNGDGMNDYFFPRQLLSKKLTAFNMAVYNRWGEKVFETKQLSGRGWDGMCNDKAQPGGVYVYIIEAVIDNGSTERYQGNVTLIR